MGGKCRGNTICERPDGGTGRNPGSTRANSRRSGRVVMNPASAVMRCAQRAPVRESRWNREDACGDQFAPTSSGSVALLRWQTSAKRE
jgi:hypothetical protein